MVKFSFVFVDYLQREKLFSNLRVQNCYIF